MKITHQHMEDSRILWHFHLMDLSVESADFILAMGSHDERVARHAAKLFLDGAAPLLVTSGGFGKVTRVNWKVTEGRRFAQIAEELGVPPDAILIEEEATNTGDNVTKTKDLLKSRKIPVDTGILVTKPYMARRAFATAAKQWPEIKWSVSAPQISFEAYSNEEVPLERMINLMVGDLQRIKVYADRGFQIPQDIPQHVWDSYERLRDAGYDQYVIPTE